MMLFFLLSLTERHPRQSDPLLCVRYSRHDVHLLIWQPA